MATDADDLVRVHYAAVHGTAGRPIRPHVLDGWAVAFADRGRRAATRRAIERGEELNARGIARRRSFAASDRSSQHPVSFARCTSIRISATRGVGSSRSSSPGGDGLGPGTARAADGRVDQRGTLLRQAWLPSCTLWHPPLGGRDRHADARSLEHVDATEEWFDIGIPGWRDDHELTTAVQAARLRLTGCG